MQIITSPTPSHTSETETTTIPAPAAISETVPIALPITSLLATFDLRLFPRQLAAFRGAIAELAGRQNDLFHNHKEDGDGVENRYPLIQYRTRGDRAAILALQEGVPALQEFLMSGHTTLKMEGRYHPLGIVSMMKEQHSLHIADKPQTFKIFKWLPLNPKNYAQWQQCADLVERIRLLERILSSQLVGFCDSMGWHAPEHVSASIQHLQLMEKVRLFDVPMLSFNITYTTRLLLPPGAGLGKAVSHGYGWQVPSAFQFDTE